MHGGYMSGERILLSLGHPPRVLCSRVLVTSYLSLLVRGGRLGSDHVPPPPLVGRGGLGSDDMLQ